MQLLVAAFVFCAMALQVSDVTCSGKAPRIVEHPTDTTVPLHEPATLNCKSDGQPEPDVRWFRDGRPVDAAGSVRKALLPDGSLLFLEASQGKRDSDSGTYWCVATNAFGEAVSRKAHLIVTYLKQDFRVPPKDASPAAGDTAFVECDPPKGHPEPAVTWHKNGEPMPADDKKRWFVDETGNLIIRDVNSEDDGSYTCVASNLAGVRKSKAITLATQMRPYMIHAPKDTVAMAGSSVQLQCKIGGTPQPEVFWKKISAAKVTQYTRTGHYKNEKISGDRDEHVYITQDGSLRLDNVTPKDEGKYVCHAENHQGKVNAASFLTVHSVPSIVQRPADTHVSTGSNAVFECGVRGNPDPTVFWSLQNNDTVLFPKESWNEFHAEDTKDSVSTLVIYNVRKEKHDQLVVMCSAINEAGSDEWRATLTVAEAAYEECRPPVIEYGPANQTLPYNSIGNLVCKAIGNPQPVITWYKDDSPLSTEAARINVTETGTLQISNLQKSDNGIYTCVASSDNGKAAWSAELKMESPKNPNVGFFRSPDSSTFPGAPSAPVVVNHTETAVTLTWGRYDKVGSSPFLGYQVEMFTCGDTVGWVTLVRRLHSAHYTQSFLKPGRTYSFLVRAENSHGLSPPSRLSSRVTLSADRRQNVPFSPDMSIAKSTLFGGHIVDLIDTKTVGPTSIKLFWEILNGEFLDGFYLYYRGKNSTGRNATFVKLLANATELSGAHVVHSLRPSVTYLFFLVPYYRHIKGRPSNSKTAKTHEDCPSEPPRHVESTVYNASSVYLKWNPPPDDSLNGAVTSYRVVIQGGAGWDVLSNATVSASTPSLLLTNLTAGVRYKVTIAAGTRVGFGPYTEPVVLPTDSTNKIKKLDEAVVDHEETGGEFVAEPWIVLLLAGIVTLMAILLAAVLFVRYRQLGAKKSHLRDSLSPANKLSYSSGFKTTLDLNRRGQVTSFLQSEHGVSNSQRCLFIDANSCHKPNWTHRDVDGHEKDSSRRLLPEIADYAEVNPNTMSTFSRDRDSSSPAPYATTTLVSNASSRNMRRNSEDAAYASANVCRAAQNAYAESAYGCCSSNNDCQSCGADDCGSMQGVPVSVVLSGCGRKTFSEVSHNSNKSGSRFNHPPYSSRQRAMIRTSCSSNGYHYVDPSVVGPINYNNHGYGRDFAPPDIVVGQQQRSPCYNEASAGRT